MTDLQIMLAVGGALGTTIGATAALLAVCLFRPERLQGAIRATSRLAARHRASRLRPTHPHRTRPDRTLDPTRRVPVAMATRGAH